MNWCKTCKKELPNEAICHAEVECSSCKAKRLEKELEQAQREREEWRRIAEENARIADERLKERDEVRREWDEAVIRENDQANLKARAQLDRDEAEKSRDDLQAKLAQSEAERERMKGALEELSVCPRCGSRECKTHFATERHPCLIARQALNPAKT